jgi:hypothetical protein
MIMQRRLVLSVCVTLSMLAGSAWADTLLLDSISTSPANDAQGVPRPTRGMSMDAVKSRFGEPSQIHARVGDPPITRWDYADYSVYFEYRHVLTSVVHH